MVKMIFAALVCTFSISALAQQPREIQYSETVLPFSDWASKNPREKAALGLFKNYVEPTVAYSELGMKKTALAKLMMFITRIRTTVNKPAGQIDLAKLISVESLAKLDPELKFQKIAPNQVMPIVAGRGPIPNFGFCNQGSDKKLINLPNFEENLSYLVGDHAWCADGRSTCVEACFIFKGKWQGGISWINRLKSAAAGFNPAPQDLKDFGLAMQAEARYFNSEAEFGQSVKELTQLNTPVKGIVELNIFYINQVLQYGKIVAVIQEHPSSPQASVVSMFTAIGVRKRTWEKYGGRLETILRGEATENTTTGLTAGIPKFSQNIARAMADVIEKQ